ncbi:MAG TPA: M56 family metallopeptidase [Bryobacteraceae bacterium]|nr:M56 family metallopeptidase [Bryobacteraceae bacterium]
MTTLWLQNLASYSLQIAAIAVAGAVLLRLLRIRLPNVRLICWQALLAACLLLPAIQPWRPLAPAKSDVQVSTGKMIPVEARRSQPINVPWSKLALLILGAGVATRFAMLGLGFWRIRRYRRNSRFAAGAFESLQRRMGVFADFQISPDVAGPVAFGFLRPVILLPASCLEDESIACHELLHVRRRDWLFAVAEECILSVLWFHPVTWWLMAEIRLAREEAVDREVVGILNSREQYLESLLALAAVRSGLDLAPASPFLRKRHLQKRVASLLKEVSMSRLRLNVSLAAFVAAVALIGWVSVKSFPLQAAPQNRTDALGVTVNSGSVKLLHRAPVDYPREALDKRIEGTVVLEISVGETGTVTDARVLSGPEELRSAALQSVLQWHYANDAHAPVKTEASVDFHVVASEGIHVTMNPRVVIGPAPPPPPPPAAVTVGRIILNVPEELRQRVQDRLTLREGDQLTGQAMADLQNAITAVDEHLRLSIQRLNGQGNSTVTIALENASPQAQAVAPGKIRVGSPIVAANLVHKVTPIYPPEAKAARIQGVVRFNATIGKDGTVQDLQLITGHPLMVQPARDAVMQWVYKPTLLNGDPVEVVTQIDVNFTLSQ